MMALLTTPGFQLNEAARLDGKKTEKGRESSGLARKTKKKEGDFFWRSQREAKGDEQLGRKACWWGIFHEFQPDSFSDLAIDSQYASPFQTWYWFGHCLKIKWIMACTIIPIPSHVHVVASMTP
ncbi:hypothetical protein CK203_048080 [Vitis vinifera]|uniref:Uncharacterized protein n=1 Tax=Vitis vinifera TaxID=29760 RepID=A0A438GYY8_VITVI|nr:hypothetical protein CK203_048080 [Vitis vinifera]